MGSNLYQDEECNNLVWANVNMNPFSSTSIYKLGSNIDISKNLYPKAAVNEVPLSEEDREYGVLGVYKTIINRLCSEFPDREVYFFSYDFRQSNADTAKKLKDFIDNKIKADSVDLVCHSMGNSVAANYALIDKSKIDKLISLGGVHEGAPKIVNATLKWSVISTTWNPADFLLGLCGLQKKVKINVSKDGQELDSSEENLSLESDYGRLDFVGGNEDIKMLAVDDEESDKYSIDLKGADEGNMDFSVAWYDEDNNLKEERVIKDVPVTATSNITTSINENNETKLMVDENGDGNVDSTVVYSKESEDNKVITLVKKDNSGDDNNFVDDSKTYNGIEESKENKEDLEELVDGNNGQAVGENLSSETAVIENCTTSNRNWMIGVVVLVIFVALGGLYFGKNRRAR